MAWRDIAESETNPNAPVTSALMKAVAANPTAIANGDPGAPRINANAFISPVTAGPVVRATVNTGNLSVYTFTQFGSLRVSANVPNNVAFRIRVNEVVLITWTSGNRSADLNIATGDDLSISATRRQSFTNSAGIRMFRDVGTGVTVRLSTSSDTFLWPYSLVSGFTP